MDFVVVTMSASIAVFGLLTMMIIPFIGRFKGLRPLDAVSRAVAGGICVTGVLAAAISLYVVGYNLITVPSPSFPFIVVFLLCVMVLAMTAGPAAICVWLSAKWLLRPVKRSGR
jgi:hypothetical protein